MRTLRTQRTTSLVDHLGRPMASTGYISGGSERRSMRGWRPSSNSADRDILPKHNSIRASSRDLAMNSPLAAGSITRLRDFVVGCGLKLQCSIDREILGLSHEDADAWERNTEREYRLHFESTNIDATRTGNIYDLQALTYVSKLISGEIFWIPINYPWNGSVYDLRIKILESDFVCNPDNMPDNDTIAGGMECNELGAPVAYHIAQKHPGGLTYSSNSWKRVLAFSPRTGMRQVFHDFIKMRPGQRRGVGIFAPVIEALKQVTRLSESELMAAVVSSFFTVFVKTPTGDGLSPAFDESTSVQDATSANAKNEYEIASGNVVDLAEGEDITMAQPSRPNANYAPFFEALSKQIGSCIGIPFEVIYGFFQSSYSAARAAMLIALKTVTVHRDSLGWSFCRPPYERWLIEAVIKGRIIAPGFLYNPILQNAWSGSKWLGQGLGQINPVVETRASIERIEGGLSTRQKEVANLDGDDWETLYDQWEREDARIKKNTPTKPESASTEINKPTEENQE